MIYTSQVASDGEVPAVVTVYVSLPRSATAGTLVVRHAAAGGLGQC